MRLPILFPSMCHLIFLIAGLPFLTTVTAWAQVADADCFSGDCGGQPGIPECPEDFDEVGFVTYANNGANITENCVTVVSCTNFSREPTVLDCRFYYGFNSLPANGDPQEALCDAVGTKPLFTGDTSECATDADDQFKAGGIYGAADGNCPTFEGKGIVCAKGGEAERILCHASLSCGNGTTVTSIPFIPSKELQKVRNNSSRRGEGVPDQRDD